MKHIRRCQFLKLEELRELPAFGAMPAFYFASWTGDRMRGSNQAGQIAKTVFTAFLSSGWNNPPA
jgi:hypothetical protein